VEADFVEAGGTQLFVRRWGEAGKPSILYWHGGGGATNELPRIAPALEAAGYVVHAPDAPGYGKSPPLAPQQYLASSIADLAVALVDRLAIAPVVWIGFSWGASIGLHATARHPDRFTGLVLLDGGYLMPEDDSAYDPSLDFAARMDAWRIELERQEDEDDAPIEIVAASMAGSNVEPALPVLSRLRPAGIPVLLVAATEPAEWNDIRARRIEQFRAVLPSAEIVRVRAGHGLLDEAGDNVRRIVVDWLRQVL
jgi:pimeloyl-ACP methyl ester carboxylesterase